MFDNSERCPIVFPFMRSSEAKSGFGKVQLEISDCEAVLAGGWFEAEEIPKQFMEITKDLCHRLRKLHPSRKPEPGSLQKRKSIKVAIGFDNWRSDIKMICQKLFLQQEFLQKTDSF